MMIMMIMMMIMMVIMMMIDHNDPWMIQMDRPWSEWVRMGRIGIAMARTGRESSSNILRVMKTHVKTFALRDFHSFFDFFKIDDSFLFANVIFHYLFEYFFIHILK